MIFTISPRFFPWLFPSSTGLHGRQRPGVAQRGGGAAGEARGAAEPAALGVQGQDLHGEPRGNAIEPWGFEPSEPSWRAFW